MTLGPGEDGCIRMNVSVPAEIAAQTEALVAYFRTQPHPWYVNRSSVVGFCIGKMYADLHAEGKL